MGREARTPAREDQSGCDEIEKNVNDGHQPVSGGALTNCLIALGPNDPPAAILSTLPANSSCLKDAIKSCTAGS